MNIAGLEAIDIDHPRMFNIDLSSEISGMLAFQSASDVQCIHFMVFLVYFMKGMPITELKWMTASEPFVCAPIKF